MTFLERNSDRLRYLYAASPALRAALRTIFIIAMLALTLAVIAAVILPFYLLLEHERPGAAFGYLGAVVVVALFVALYLDEN